MLNHQVSATIDDQVAVTRVEQTFRNHTSRALEATYVFPVPRGASVRRFSMWVNGSEVRGEMVEADKARQVYTDIVRRTQDPGLLEYIGNDLLRMRVFPVPAQGDQKVAVSFTSVAPRSGDLVEYVYPLKSSAKAVSTLEKFSVTATVKSQHPVLNVYSPSHALNMKRVNDREVGVSFERDRATLDKDFQLFYSLGDKDVGLTALTHRPLKGENGYFLVLVSPRVELPKSGAVPRDLVFVLDTSGSMRGLKLQQGKKALKYCLDNLNPRDRFALIHFATSVNRYKDGLLEATSEQIATGRKWVDDLECTGGTAIDDALSAALQLRPPDDGRTFTVVFFTDGQPTIGETNPDKILHNVTAKNSTNTRIFTFGVGDDVNATMLDQLAERTRAVSTYVRPAEDIEVKVSSLYGTISHPVLANLKLSAGGAVELAEIYPTQLPDLFHGGQLVVLGRYRGTGHAALKLAGSVGKENREFVYEIDFPEQTKDDHEFVEHLWARRKVGYLLDQIRLNGEKKELVDETVLLAKKHGIATPYTSYLVVPDGPVPLAGAGGMGGGRGGMMAGGAMAPPALRRAQGGPAPVHLFLGQIQNKEGLERARTQLEDEQVRRGLAQAGEAKTREMLREVQEKRANLSAAYDALKKSDKNSVQAGKLGVDLSVQTNNLRNQARLETTAQQKVYGRNCLEIGGLWIDEDFDGKMPTLTVKAQSDAYFRLLEKQPRLKDVFRLGNHVVWVTPNGTALVIDTSEGKEKLTDAEIDRLFIAQKK
jgi:Ca-activated chloride channel family protein